MRFKQVGLMSLMVCLVSVNANAFEFERGNYSFKLNGYGVIAAFDSDLQEPDFIGDWRVRGQFNYAITSNTNMGLVYAIDELAIHQDKFSRDAFLFLEDATYGRIEIGLTDSIATKLGVGLPDVGALRVNDNPLLYKRIDRKGDILSNTTLTSGRYDLRANFVTVPTKPLQFGISVAGLSDNYDYAADIGVKYRNSDGKTKTAVSFGASFIDSPDNFQTDIYAPGVTADYRAQISAGLNLQYNSWIWGLSARAVYDYNAIGPAADGIVAGTGVSYDLLGYTLSASYLLSAVGVWDDADSYMAHTGILSFRYKYSQNVDGWISGGMSLGKPFLGAGLRIVF